MPVPPSPPQSSDRSVVHLICNAHLDPVWLWEWEEGAAEAISTFRSAVELCETTPGMVFNHNESLLYEWIEEYEPALFERIKKQVEAGRWHVMGGWYLQPDCNLPGGEGFVRQALVGKAYFADRFGVEPTTAINFDPVGHDRG
ncbi:MAG: alpha-mannosidase, partial [Planctomycetota bacterium]